MSPPRTMTGPVAVGRLLLACFVLSGATGLVYEVAWTRSLALVFGSTTFAVGTTLAAFMAGLGAGALVFGKLADRSRHALRIYGLLEIGIAASAIALPFVLPGLDPVYRAVWERYHPSFAVLSLLRFGICFLLLLGPTMLMGGTLPVLVRHFESRPGDLGRRAGLLYGLNTLGAVLGAGVAGFALLPWLGLDATTVLAASFNIEIGVMALSLSRYGRSPTREVGTPGLDRSAPLRPSAATVSRREETPGTSPSGVFAVAALSGFVALLAEVAWTRGLTLVLGSSTYAFTTMLVTFLAGLAGGSLIMARFLGRTRDLVWTLALLQGGIGVASLASAHLFPELPLLYLHLSRAVDDVPALVVASQVVLSALIMLLPAMLMGAVFPVVVKLASGAGSGAGEQVGRVYAANTAGGVLGAVGGGFVLIPQIGIANSLVLGVALSMAVALGVLVASGARWRRASVAAALLASVPLLAPRWEALAMSSGVYKEAPLYLSLFPNPRDVFTRLLPQFRLLYYREGPTATVTVTERPSLEDHRHLALAIDGKVDASTASDMPTQVLSGHIPLLLHPAPEKVLVIGLASGVTLGAVTRHSVAAVTTVEIEPAVVEASRFFAPFNHRPLDDPRVRLVVEDARNLLLLSRDRYDVIVSEPSNPWMSGPAKLFTREFFELGRERLEPRGLFVQWLQLYGMTEGGLKVLLRTFQSAFPRLVVFQPTAGDLLLVGSADAVRVPVRPVRERMREPAVAADLARVGVHDVFDLLTRFRMGEAEARAYAGDGPLNTDDNALIEFSAPWQIHLETAARNAEALARAGHRVAPYLEFDGTPAGEQADFLSRLAARVLASGDARQAEATAREALGLSASAEAFWVLGEAAARQGRDAEALRAWDRAVTVDHGHAGALLSLGAYHQERGDGGEARRHLAPLGGRYRDDPVVNFLLGVNRYHLRLHRSAIAFLSRATRPPVPDGPSAAWSAIHYPRGGPGVETLARYYLHLAYGKLGDRREEHAAWAGFLEALDDWRRQAERQSPDRANLALFDRIGFRSGRAVRPEEAHLAEVLARRVLEPMTRYYEGVSAYLTGYPDVARTKFESVLARLGAEGARSRTRYWLGLAHWKLGQFAEARSDLEGFLDHLEGRDRRSLAAAEASRALAATYAAQGQRDRAAEVERRAQDLLREVEQTLSGRERR